MSLQVWLPLNGDLRNNGLSNVTITNNGATVDNNGKIGKCYYFNGSSYIRISLPSELTSIKNSSVCAWVKSTGSTVALGGISSNSTYAYPMMTLYTSGWQFAGTSAYKYISGGSIANSGVWHHVCCTAADDIVTTYLDGVVVASKTYSEIGSDKWILNSSINFIEIGCDHPGGDEYLTGYVNDFRVYNHCLSAKEVKELSKGLVAHYKLTGALDGLNPNMLKATPKSHNAAAYNAYQFNLTENLIAGETYTIQLWDVDVSHSAKTEANLGVWVYWGGGSVSLLSWYGTTYFTNGHADHLTATFTVTSSQASGSGATNSWLNIYNSVGYVAGNLNMSIGRWKVEKGNIATGYTRTIAEMNLDETTVYDCSGYNNNGISNGTFSLSNDTARYSVSTIFNGTNNQIEADPLPAETQTISIWVKTTWTSSSGYRLAVHDKVAGLAIGWSANQLITYVGSSNGGSGSRVLMESSTYTANQWNHIVVVKTGANTRNVYINGALVTPTGANYWGGSINKLDIGCRNNGSYNAYFNGQLSDFRAYATALSVDDVLDLYHTSATIDKSGNMYGYELREV